MMFFQSIFISQTKSRNMTLWASFSSYSKIPLSIVEITVLIAHLDTDPLFLPCS